MNTLKNAVRVASLVLGLAAVADVAEACSFACVNVGPGFCQRCLHVGYPTGGYCQDQGQCGCIDVQDVCWNAVSLTGLDQVMAEITAAPEPDAAPVTPVVSPAQP